MYKTLVATALTAGVLSASAGFAVAFDPTKVGDGDAGPQIILRYGYDALKAGKMEEALGAFRHNADQNHLPSQWKLARMLQSGNGVQRDQLAAYELYSKIADRFAERPPTRSERPYVSSAIVELGKYALVGIEGTRVMADAQIAETHFNRAALLYGDANAQYYLGHLYLDESRGMVNPVRAARWFKRASRKGHVLAQAQLGQMLFHGQGVRRNPVLGLVYLTRASATGRAQKLRQLRKDAFASASDAQRRAAKKILDKLNIVVENEELAPIPSGGGAFGLQANTSE
ncbi:tetratricopeptide repeat protein [Pseudahrensia aquimaris]|uniref:Tetratricopeptide repeat protein n=1 Tax=Pseudahrensia aquimaris TaxID=744461 RepID=A0ABW3FMQ1_9HYPH